MALALLVNDLVAIDRHDGMNRPAHSTVFSTSAPLIRRCVTL
jgi:hypothetical protein